MGKLWILYKILPSLTLLVTIACTFADIFSNEWTAEVLGGPEVAHRVADKHGFTFIGRVIRDTYLFQHNHVAKRSLDPHHQTHSYLETDPACSQVVQQVVKRRAKRDFATTNHQSFSTRSFSRMALTDPRWPQMWYLNRGNDLDMKVREAWEQGVTGRGVVVTILDDGLEKDHPDIKSNYDPKASYDVNNHDDDPQPRYDLIDSNRHGTRCAGEVAAEANNSLCAVGVAYRAGIGGVRMLDGDVTDAVEARSLSLNPQHIHIYSASWGPDDDGKTVDGPGELATKAFVDGVNQGRGGLGSIFVWASGNGGRDHDNCNCDGYTNSIWTLSISSATENGLVPWYSEACSSTLATTYSSGSSGEKQVITTDLHFGCTSTHTGTSASAPLAAGICALALEANPRLTWRDMQHVVVLTARPFNLHAVDWAINGVGRNVSHSFGYGLMDAGAMVDMARTWKKIPKQRVCEVRAPQQDKLIPAKSMVSLKLDVNCPDIKYLEHVQAKVTMATTRRGDIQIYMTSPMGTKSCLLAIRPNDASRAGFQDWPFMTVHSWGENPRGTWTLEIHNEGRYQASISNWHLVLYGTSTPAQSQTPAAEPTSHALGEAEHVAVLFNKSHQMTTVAYYDSDIENANLADSARGHNRGQNGSCRTVASSGIACIECKPSFYLLDGYCVTECPAERYYPLEYKKILENGSDQSDSHRCAPCHYSCRTCNGPNDCSCTTCFDDATLNDHYCRPSALLRVALITEKWQTAILVIFVVMATAIVLLVVLLLKVYFNRSSSKNYSVEGGASFGHFMNNHRDYKSLNDSNGKKAKGHNNFASSSKILNDSDSQDDM